MEIVEIGGYGMRCPRSGEIIVMCDAEVSEPDWIVEKTFVDGCLFNEGSNTLMDSFFKVNALRTAWEKHWDEIGHKIDDIYDDIDEYDEDESSELTLHECLDGFEFEGYIALKLDYSHVPYMDPYGGHWCFFFVKKSEWRDDLDVEEPEDES
jgi:hypothetical protein